MMLFLVPTQIKPVASTPSAVTLAPIVSGSQPVCTFATFGGVGKGKESGVGDGIGVIVGVSVGCGVSVLVGRGGSVAVGSGKGVSVASTATIGCWIVSSCCCDVAVAVGAGKRVGCAGEFVAKGVDCEFSVTQIKTVNSANNNVSNNPYVTFVPEDLTLSIPSFCAKITLQMLSFVAEENLLKIIWRVTITRRPSCFLDKTCQVCFTASFQMTTVCTGAKFVIFYHTTMAGYRREYHNHIA